MVSAPSCVSEERLISRGKFCDDILKMEVQHPAGQKEKK